MSFTGEPIVLEAHSFQAEYALNWTDLYPGCDWCVRYICFNCGYVSDWLPAKYKQYPVKYVGYTTEKCVKKAYDLDLILA